MSSDAVTFRSGEHVVEGRLGFITFKEGHILPVYLVESGLDDDWVSCLAKDPETGDNRMIFFNRDVILNVGFAKNFKMEEKEEKE